MAAYAAVISLKHTINSLRNSSSPNREILEFVYDETESLQRVLEGLNESGRSRSSMKRVDDLEGQIRDCANHIEDFLESHEMEVEEEADEVRKEITSFSEAVKKMTKEYMKELSRSDDDDEDEDDEDADEDDDVEMVGNSSAFADIQETLVDKMRPDDLCYYSFLGEKGGGRTIAARSIYEDLSKSRGEYFDCWAWVTVGPTESKQVLMSIIAQVEARDGDDVVSSGDDESELSKYLWKALENRRYMIILDDVDDAELLDYLQRTSFPEESNGSMVIVTTTSTDVAELSDRIKVSKLPDRFFQDTAWPLLRATFLGSDSNTNISPEMEEAGKQIVQNCRCLIVALAKTYVFLSKTGKTVEEWSKLAADKENPIFMVADELSEKSKITAYMQSLDMSDEDNVLVAEMILAYLDLTSDAESMMIHMHPSRLFSKMQIISNWGMAGIGKTTFTRKVFIDESIRRHFDHHVWIRLGPKYQTQDILMDILTQIFPKFDKLYMKGDETLTKDLCVEVSKKRCLIVLDDLCSQSPLHHLKDVFPEIKGTTLVTTRLAKVAKLGTRDDMCMQIDLLDEEESWCLLCRKVFAGEPCPPVLEKAGRMIAEKCDGLPLLILTVADQLLRVEQCEEYWMNVALGKEKAVFKNAHHLISEALLPSYQGLPQHLKPCFLYLGVFREKYEIPTSNLTNMWIAEGFLKPNSQLTQEVFVAKCLSELADASLLIVENTIFGSQIKACRLHSIFWHLSNSQVVENKFFHAMNSYGDCSMESVESQRRLCIRNSTLLGIKDVQNSMASNIIARSLLCVGPFQQFPVPLNIKMRLLRVMNALAIRFYEFPDEVVKLVHLRYLGLTCNGKLPASISTLQKLQYLIVKRSGNINSSQNSSHLPVEIWDMKELEHLEVMGGRLPNRKSGPGLRKLIALLDVSAKSCRKKVLKWIPNLQRLGIRIELMPGDVANSFNCLNRISRLRRLESLKCAVVNPQFSSEDAPPPAPISMFPASLKRLSLSGLGYPWEYMHIIGKLENLEILKLKCYAFRGPMWEMDGSNEFSQLKFLLLQSSNLVQWKGNPLTSMFLDGLSIKHCYTLQELPVSAPIVASTTIGVVDCNPLVVSWGEYLECELAYLAPRMSSSWMAPVKQE